MYISFTISTQKIKNTRNSYYLMDIQSQHKEDRRWPGYCSDDGESIVTITQQKHVIFKLAFTLTWIW